MLNYVEDYCIHCTKCNKCYANNGGGLWCDGCEKVKDKLQEEKKEQE